MAKASYGAGSTSLNDFKQQGALGEGAYSTVYKVTRLADGKVYALKKVKLPSLSEKEKQNALNEVRLLASIKDHYIIDYKEAFFDDKSRCLCIVQEFASAGDLFQQISKCQKDKTHLREADVWRYLYGMCMGLRALHDMRILHRDLKSANVFLSTDKDGATAKLGDFNVSKVAKRGLCMTQTGTPYYASPEVWRDMPYDAKSDMWSLGCVLYEMVGLRPPFKSEDMEGLYRKVLKGQYPRIPAQYSQDMNEVISKLLQVNPRHRPTVDELLQTPVMRRHMIGSAMQPPTQLGEMKSVNNLLQTIKLPKNVIDISVLLPKPRYDLPKAIEEDIPPKERSMNTMRHERQELQEISRGLDRESYSSVPPPPQPPINSLLRGAAAVGYQHSSVGSETNLRSSAGNQHGEAVDSLDMYLQQRDQPSHRPMYAPIVREPSVASSAVAPPVRTHSLQPRVAASASRPVMSNYVRAQYQLNTQAPPPMPTPNGGGSSLRLPRIS